jgi:GTP-binding protein EngB required for normal cell division
MGIDGHNNFSRDVLCIEVSGPTKPNITLTDMPGLFHASDERQSKKDKEFVHQLTKEYMAKNTRYIKCIVTSAKNEVCQQLAREYATNVDPGGDRTLGILTKPDLLDDTPSLIPRFVSVVRNETYQYKYGWFVVKGRSPKERHFSVAERNLCEERHLSQNEWADVPADRKGIASLRAGLQDILQQAITADLPSYSMKQRPLSGR